MVLALDDNGHLSEQFSFPVGTDAHVAAAFQFRVVVFEGGKCSVYNAKTGKRERSWDRLEAVDVESPATTDTQCAASPETRFLWRTRASFLLLTVWKSRAFEPYCLCV